MVLALIARLSGRLPLVLRYAVRDADRHRTRTVPAVSAVAATVAGVVALGIGLTSDDAENEATYQPSLAAGVGIVDRLRPRRLVAGVARRARPGAAGSHRDRAAGAGRGRTASPRCSGPRAGPSWTARAARSGPTSWSPTTACRSVSSAWPSATSPRAEQMLRQGGMVAFVSPGRSVDGGHRDRGPARLRPGHRRGHRDPAREGAGRVRQADRPVGRPGRGPLHRGGRAAGRGAGDRRAGRHRERDRAAGGGRQRGAGRGLRRPRRCTSSAATRPTTRP